MPDLKEAKEQVIYKVGRNVLLFQQLENLLKFLVSNGSVSAYAGELVSMREKQTNSILKKTLGMVTGQYLDNADPRKPPEDLRKAHVTIKFSMNDSEDKREVLESLVAERNHLVHHFLMDIDKDSTNSWSKAGQQLDEQSDKLESEITYLRQVVGTLNDRKRDLAEYINSEEFKDALG